VSIRQHARGAPEEVEGKHADVIVDERERDKIQERPEALRNCLKLVVRSAESSAGYVTSAYVSIRQHTSAYVSIRQHTSAYVSKLVVRSAESSAGYECLFRYIRSHTASFKEAVRGEGVPDVC
jgi:hypothetical protein